MWRHWKHKRNQLTNVLEIAKKVYYSAKLNNPREIWNTIKRISQGEKSVVLNSIIHEGKLISDGIFKETYTKERIKIQIEGNKRPKNL